MGIYWQEFLLNTMKYNCNVEIKVMMMTLGVVDIYTLFHNSHVAWLYNYQSCCCCCVGVISVEA